MSTTSSGASGSIDSAAKQSDSPTDEKTDASPVFEVYSDASLNPEQQAVGAGWVVCRDDRVLCRGSRGRTGQLTTQEAEAFAVKCAVEQLQAMDWFESDITVHTDNEGVAIGFERETRLHRSDIYCELLEYLSEAEVEQISRDENTMAHDLSQKARERVEESSDKQAEELCPHCGTTDPRDIECRCESRSWYNCSSCNRSFFDRE